MARAVARIRELHCHSCSRTWKALVWGYDENWTKPRQPITCTCPTPHIEVLPDWRRYNSLAQCRAEQRAAVYLMPDGSVSVPSSNRYDDEIALDAVRQGGVRQEFPTVRDMQRFQKDRQQYEGDEYTDRCMVIDHDQRTILNGDTILRERIKREDRERQRVYDRQRSGEGLRGRVLFGGDYYDRVRARNERR